MADKDQVARLREGVDAWNSWRRPSEYEYSTTAVDLSHFDLSGSNLVGIDLFGANLIGADLSGADLSN
jgi:uncharacterized protein YjbI with pentapeptide repeats